ncbi:hypothetical protein D3C81_1954840 [compost metagenome]
MRHQSPAPGIAQAQKQSVYGQNPSGQQHRCRSPAAEEKHMQEQAGYQNHKRPQRPPEKSEHPQLSEQNHYAGSEDKYTQFRIVFGRHISLIPSEIHVFSLSPAPKAHK